MEESQKFITIADLAEILDVSSATVSRALNDDPTVKKQTKKRVFELAEKMGYRANDYARRLKNGHGNTIGCIIPRLDDQLMAGIVTGLEKAARRVDYSLVLMQSDGERVTEAYCANVLFKKRVDGLVACLSEETNELAHFTSFIQKHVPVILLDRAHNDPAFVNIYIDNRRAGYDVTRHLLELGRRRIVHITYDKCSPAYVERCEGYKQALAEAGIPVHEEYIIRCGLTPEEGGRLAGSIGQWTERPDAVFAASDYCAVGLIRSWQDLGIRVPEEIAVAGFGNEPVSTWANPQLTTVCYPGELIGDTAVNQMMQCLQGTAVGKAVGSIGVRTELVVRGSTIKR